MGDRLASILGGTRQDKSLGDVEMGRGADLANSLTVDTLKSGLFGSLSLVGSYSSSVRNPSIHPFSLYPYQRCPWKPSGIFKEGKKKRAYHLLHLLHTSFAPPQHLAWS
jgi:hypothetical protein